MNQISDTDTPPVIDQLIVDFCDRVVAGSSPIYVDVKVEEIAVENDCFNNVNRKIEKEGGSSIIGWTIWLWPEVLVEAEFHAIWKNESGDLVDITPKDIPTQRILFLPDAKATYKGVDVNNVRYPIQDTKIINNFITFSNIRYKMFREGRIDGSFEVSLPKEDYELLTDIGIITQNMITNKISRNDRCLCGSNIKYKRCHEKQLYGMAAHYEVPFKD